MGGGKLRIFLHCHLGHTMQLYFLYIHFIWHYSIIGLLEYRSNDKCEKCCYLYFLILMKYLKHIFFK